MIRCTLFTILLILSLGAFALPAMATSGDVCTDTKPDGPDNCGNEPKPDNLCPDGTEVPNDQTCPPVQCPDGTEVPNGETCPPVQCPDGTEVPNGETCPPVQCPDGTEVPNGQTCPLVQCPDGTEVPNGQICPGPDLSGQLTVRQMIKQVAHVTIKVTNTGTASALSASDGGYTINVGLFSSPKSKTPIPGTRIVGIKSTRTLKPGFSEDFQVDVPLTSPLPLPQSQVLVCADIDPEGVVKESNKDNNRTCQAN